MRGFVISQEEKKERVEIIELSLLQKKERGLNKKEAFICSQLKELVENYSSSFQQRLNAQKLERKIIVIERERREIEKKKSLMQKKIIQQLKERKIVENIRKNNYYCSSSTNKEVTKRKDATHLFFQNI